MKMVPIDWLLFEGWVGLISVYVYVCGEIGVCVYRHNQPKTNKRLTSKLDVVVCVVGCVFVLVGGEWCGV